MKNDKTTISATEISKYTYCPYRWYYERFYGSTYLKEERAKMLEDAGFVADPKKSRFVLGQKFHDDFLEKYQAKAKMKWLVFFLTVTVIMFFVYVLFFF